MYYFYYHYYYNIIPIDCYLLTWSAKVEKALTSWQVWNINDVSHVSHVMHHYTPYFGIHSYVLLFLKKKKTCCCLFILSCLFKTKSNPCNLLIMKITIIISYTIIVIGVYLAKNTPRFSLFSGIPIYLICHSCQLRKNWRQIGHTRKRVTLRFSLYQIHPCNS